MTRHEVMESSEMYEKYKNIANGSNHLVKLQQKSESDSINSVQWTDGDGYTSSFWLTEQEKDPDITIVKTWISEENKVQRPNQLPINLKRYHNKLKNLNINQDGLLCKTHHFRKTEELKDLICVPETCITKVIQVFHETSCQHFSSDKCTNSIKRKFWFPNMKEEIKLFCENCEICFKINLMAVKKPKPPLKPYPYNYPGIAVNMDVITITKHHGS